MSPHSDRPPWAHHDPDLAQYTSIEVAIAGALSTLPPLDHWHPIYALPFARVAIEAAAAWEPDPTPTAIDPDQLALVDLDADLGPVDEAHAHHHAGCTCGHCT